MPDWAKLEQLDKRFAELEKLIIDPETIARSEEYKSLLKEHGGLAPAARLYREYRDAGKELASVEEMLAKSASDEEMKALAEEEKRELDAKLKRLQVRLDEETNPAKKQRNSVIMEIRAGTGGDEAALFAADLFRMYTRYAEQKGWKTEMMDSHATGLKGFKEVVFTIEAPGVFNLLMYESGTHRVQRVPETEASGRIHTSAVTVAVLPEVEELELKIGPDELRIDTYRASGHGGQHLQKTDSAVRITHLPSGVVVQCQDERSQLKNKLKAMSFLRAKLFEKMISDQQSEISSSRRQQVGSGDRSEKIRTYNFPQNRVTDHRVGVSVYNLESVIEGEMDALLEQVRKGMEAQASGNGG